MDPQDFHEPPEDVKADQRLRIPAPDLEAEADEIASSVREATEKYSEPVTVSASAKTGKIRRNGPCPCGSGAKFKKCCLDKVRAGELQTLRFRRQR